MAAHGRFVLELDLGNTRLKWRCVDAGDLAAVVAGGFVVRAQHDGLGSGLAALQVELAARSLRDEVTGVRVVSVASLELGQEVARWGLSLCGEVVQFAQVSRSAAGVINGYDDYARLGVDRWLAILAAQQLSPQGFCVVDCGSAVTLDVVVAGRHLGGYIVPGLGLMSGALFSKTDGVQVAAAPLAPSDSLMLGRNTEDAVNLGLPMMVAGLVIELLIRLERERGFDGSLVLTGGDAPVVANLIGRPLLCVPDLVLDGLEVADLSSIV